MAEPAADISIDVHLGPDDWAHQIADRTREGLLAAQPWIPPVWFYDDVGSGLFDEITRLPEYYVTRAEAEILSGRAAEIASITQARTLTELGSGTSEKTRILLDALQEGGPLEQFVPFDVSEGTLREAAVAIAAEHPGLAVHGVVGDFHHHLEDIPLDGPRLLAFLGSTIGNLDPKQRARFLFDVDTQLVHGEWFLLGTDLVKDPARLLAAYDDAQGVTARFNLNALRVMQRELGMKVDEAGFTHAAHWDPEEKRIEMRLVAQGDQRLAIPRFDDLEITISDGSWLRTEISSKFTIDGIGEELWAAGLVAEHQWTDQAEDFLITLARPYC